MPQGISAAAPHPADVSLQALDDLLDEAARLARSGLGAAEFHVELLQRALRALGASAGAVWVRSQENAWRSDARAEPPAGALLDLLAGHAGHRELLESVAAAGEPRLILPQSRSAAGVPLNPSDLLLILCPFSLAEEPGAAAAVLEIAQRAGGSPASQAGYVRLLEALCELAADFHRRRRLHTLESLASLAERAAQFGMAIHRSLDLAPTALAIVNEGRLLIGCDRLSLVLRRRNKLRLISASGLESLDRRANAVRQLEDLTAAVLAAEDPLWYEGADEALPPQISKPLQAFQDESHARSLAIVPLHAAGPDRLTNGASRPIGALIAERFSGEPFDHICRERIHSVGRQSALAVRNALEYQDLPFLPALRTLQRASWFIAVRHLPRTVTLLGLLAVVMLCLVFIPADFEVEGRGVLQPRERREVFARGDGIVNEVLVEHGHDCRQGDILVRMSRSQLDFEWARVLGELATARKKLAGVQGARLDLRPQSAAERDKYNQFAAEEEELQELLKGLESQHDVLKRQREELAVTSPISGQVVTWNVRQNLLSRPVQRGQALLEVADLSGPWVLEVEVPDERIGYVLDARERLHRDLEVSFMLATDPGTLYHGAVEKIALATDVWPPEKAGVQVTVRINREQVPRLRPGATAVSQIHCGRRSLGFVWFHGLWETLLKKVFF